MENVRTRFEKVPRKSKGSGSRIDDLNSRILEITGGGQGLENVRIRFGKVPRKSEGSGSRIDGLSSRILGNQR